MKAADLLTVVRSTGMNSGLFVQNNIPLFLWNHCPVTVVTPKHSLTYMVMPDYLSLGDNDDYVRVPTTPLAVKIFMDQFGYRLPTKTMVDQIYQQSTCKIRAVTWGEMYDKAKVKHNRDSVSCYVNHNNRLQLLLGAARQPLGALVAGHKKDVVLSNLLNLKSNKGNVAIYGWFKENGSVWQNLNAVSHTVSYWDYSHGLRMIDNRCVLDGTNTTLDQVWSDPELCKLIHDEPLLFKGY